MPSWFRLAYQGCRWASPGLLLSRQTLAEHDAPRLGPDSLRISVTLRVYRLPGQGRHLIKLFSFLLVGICLRDLSMHAPGWLAFACL